jgi:uncharacterized RDD family membrane protein YckC
VPHSKRAIKPAGLFARAAAFAIDVGASAGIAAFVAQRLGGPLAVLVVVAAIGAYFTLYWSGPMQSIGNSALRLTVIGIDGQYIGWRRAAIRLAAVVLGSLPFFIGFTAALSDESRQTWHDKAAGTYVIESPFRNRGIREWARLTVGAQDWRPHPFAVTPQRRWPPAVAAMIPILSALATWFVLLPFLRLLAAV